MGEMGLSTGDGDAGKAGELKIDGGGELDGEDSTYEARPLILMPRLFSSPELVG